MNPNNQTQPTSTPPTPGVSPPPMPAQFPQQQPPQLSPQPLVPPQKSKKPLIFVGIGILVVILIILGVVLALFVNKKPSSTTSSTTPNGSNSPIQTAGSNSEKTSNAKDAAKQAVRYPELYFIDHNDTYPTQLSQLDTIEKTYPGGVVISPTKITSAPSNSSTVNLYVCKTDGVPSTLSRADYWDYTQGKLVQYTGYTNTDQHVTSCSFLQ